MFFSRIINVWMTGKMRKSLLHWDMGKFCREKITYMKEDDVKEAVKKNEKLQLTDVVKQGDWRAVMAKLQ